MSWCSFGRNIKDVALMPVDDLARTVKDDFVGRIPDVGSVSWLYVPFAALTFGCGGGGGGPPPIVEPPDNRPPVVQNIVSLDDPVVGEESRYLFVGSDPDDDPITWSAAASGASVRSVRSDTAFVVPNSSSFSLQATARTPDGKSDVRTEDFSADMQYSLRLLDATDHRRTYDAPVLINGVSFSPVDGVVEFLAMPDAVVAVETTGVDYRRMGVVREVGPNNIYDGAVVGGTLDDRVSHVDVRVGDAADLVMFVLPRDEAEIGSNQGFNFSGYRHNLTNMNPGVLTPEQEVEYLAQFPHMGLGPNVDPDGLTDGEHDITQVFNTGYTSTTAANIQHYQTEDVETIASQTFASVAFHTADSAPEGRVVLEWFDGPSSQGNNFDFDTGHKTRMEVRLRADRDNGIGVVNEELGNAVFLPYEGRNENIMFDVVNDELNPSEYMRDAFAVWTAYGPLPRGIWTGQFIE